MPINIPQDKNFESYYKGTIIEHLGIQITEISPISISATMPVDHRTIQPHQILHGGASVVLAETLGSIGSNLCLDSSKQYAVGLEVNANHLRQAKEGLVAATAKLVHEGRKTHVWNIELFNLGKIICTSRLTIMVLDK